jgi:hypothetical protein
MAMQGLKMKNGEKRTCEASGHTPPIPELDLLSVSWRSSPFLFLVYDLREKNHTKNQDQIPQK